MKKQKCLIFLWKSLKKVQISSDFFQPIWNKMRSLYVAICNSIVKSCRFAKPISSLVVQPRKCAYYLHFAMLTLKMKQFLTVKNSSQSTFFKFSKLWNGGDVIGHTNTVSGKNLTKRRLCLTFISPNQTDLSLWPFSSVKSKIYTFYFLLGPVTETFIEES